jgi:hypothetical protein
MDLVRRLPAPENRLNLQGETEPVAETRFHLDYGRLASSAEFILDRRSGRT